nr:DpnII family type II restriction endonuclease [Helicobacter pylori]
MSLFVKRGWSKFFVTEILKIYMILFLVIEVGLDSNARKNRSGKVIENHLSGLFIQAQLNFKEQVDIREFKDLRQAFGNDIKKFDFIIFGKNKTYFIEANFYTISGSKLNEVARSYQDLALKFEAFPNYEFIWITDGTGWLDAKSKLQEAYKSVEIYNLSYVNDFISKAQKW